MTGPSYPPPPVQNGPGSWDDPWRRFETAGQEPARRPLSKAAVTSLVFGIIGGIPLALGFGVAGLVVTGKQGTRRGRGLAVAGLALALVWVLAVAALVVWAVQRQPERDRNGTVSGAGVASVFDLKAGDCLRDPAAEGGVITEAAVVPCTQPHLGQIVVEVPLTGGTFDTDRVDSEAEKGCQAAAPKALTADAPADLQLFYLVPDADSWSRAGSHTASCVVSSSKTLTKSYVS